MVASILGRFLVSGGKLSEEQFAQILEAMDKVRVKMGLMAVSEGLMTAGQAEEVNRQQAVVDKRFGDIAIEKGYLTNEQVGNLLKLQGNEYLAFVQAGVDCGALKMEEMEGILRDFQKQNNFTNSELEAIKSGDTDNTVLAFLPPEALKYQELIGVAVRTILRCTDRYVYIGAASVGKKLPVGGMVSQPMEGSPDVTTAFAEAEGGLVAMASAFSKEEMLQVDEDSLDAAGELLNCINGLYASKKSREGIALELLPPVYAADVKETGTEYCIVPVYVKNKKLYFMVTEG